MRIFVEKTIVSFMKILIVILMIFIIVIMKGGAPKGGVREPKRAHLRVPALQTPPTFNEKTPKKEGK